MIACVNLPYFAAAVERRSDDTLKQKPLAIGGHSWEARPVYAFSQEVAHRGVSPGMSLRLVNVLSPESHFLPAAKPQYGRVSAEVVDVLTDFSDTVEPQELWHSFADSDLRQTAHGRTLPARYCLDLDSLPLAEASSFVGEMGKQMRDKTQLAPAIGLAQNKFTAQVAAAVARPNHLLPVETDNQADFLANRSIEFLSLGKETFRRLRLLGIRTLGQLAALPITALKEQFGAEIEPAYRLAQGEAVEALQSSPPKQEETRRHWFDDPIEDGQVITAVFRQMAHELAAHLQKTVFQARTLSLTLNCEDGEQTESVTLHQPTMEAERLKAVTQELFACFDLTSGVLGMSLAITDLLPATARQLTFFPDTAVSAQLQRTLENLAAKYGNGRFIQPSLVANYHPLPERRFQLTPVLHDPALA
jgi:DNA polymerase-4